MRFPAVCWAAPLLALAIVSCGAKGAPQEDAAPSSRLPARSEVPGPGPPPNRLIHESSPYLLLHAHNPVDWYPWGEEAIEKARREGKPIFLSIGYSTCYWCHVMEREVFSNGSIAQLMNQWFVSIKVDREERPEIDEIYMSATQVLTQSGGWPNSLFLTPELKPFLAGTYFPPDGFRSVLEQIHRAWQERRAEVTAQADRVAAAMNEAIAERREPARELPGPAVAQRAVADLKSRYDAANGGFGGPPKFPSPGNLFLLWEEAERGDSQVREMVLQTLLKMGRGAIYDQLDGGFHRYTLDGRWRVPHFEKMLYDNAHLAELLAVTWKATGDPELERLTRGTLDFVLREMTLPDGAFKSAIDAETDGEEGAYYTWTEGELRQVLGPEGYSLLAPTFGFDGQPNFEEKKYTLYLTQPLGERAKALGLTRQQLLDRLNPHLEKLRVARHKRKFPLVDDKALADWNGMMIAAMAQAGHLLKEPRYLRAAAQAAGFVLANLKTQEGTLLHSWRGGTAKIPAFLDDYAFLIRGLLALHEATGESRWLREAERLAAESEGRLRDPQGGYYLSEAKRDLLFQPKTAADGAIPAGNSVMVLDLLSLADRTGKQVYRSRAEQAMRAFAGDLERLPAAFPSLALAVFRLQGGRAEPGKVRPTGEAAAAGSDTIESQAQDVVAVAARLTRPADRSGWAPFEVELTLRPGWHVNANPASLGFLVPTEIQGEVRNVTYPQGEGLKFQFAEEILKVYSGKALIRGEVRPGRGAILLRYQACDDRRCLPPVKKTVDFESTKPAAGNGG